MPGEAIVATVTRPSGLRPRIQLSRAEHRDFARPMHGRAARSCVRASTPGCKHGIRLGVFSAVVRRFLANRGAVAGAVLVMVLLVLVVWPHGDPVKPDIDHGLTALGAPLPPSSHALLGTDALGRDVWARLCAGAGTSLEIATLSTLLALVIGLGVGLTAGYAGGRVDTVLMRVVDLVLAFPFLLLAILLAALLREADLAAASAPVVLTLGIVGWTTIARVVRGKALSIARSEHVVAARALGA